MNASRVYVKNRHVRNFLLRIHAESQQNESIKMVSGDKNWVTYVNEKRKRSGSKRSEPSRTVAKWGLTARKFLLSLWWDWQRIIYYELLPGTCTINNLTVCRKESLRCRHLWPKQAIYGESVEAPVAFNSELKSKNFYLFCLWRHFW